MVVLSVSYSGFTLNEVRKQKTLLYVSNHLFLCIIPIVAVESDR